MPLEHGAFYSVWCFGFILFVLEEYIPCTYAFTHTPSLAWISKFISLLFRSERFPGKIEMIILLYSAWKPSNSLVSSFTVFCSLYFLFVLLFNFFLRLLGFILGSTFVSIFLWHWSFCHPCFCVSFNQISLLLRIWGTLFLRWICRAAPLLSDQACFCFAPLFCMLRFPAEQLLSFEEVMSYVLPVRLGGNFGLVPL